MAGSFEDEPRLTRRSFLGRTVGAAVAMMAGDGLRLLGSGPPAGADRGGSVWHGPATKRLRLGLAGDTMLGRRVGEALLGRRPASLVAPEVADLAREADLFVLNLECCISMRGSRWPAAGKPFFFRAPPAAVDLLAHLGVDCVTLANNHALDFGPDALLDTLEHLRAAGIRWVGAGPDLESAREAAVLQSGEFRLKVVGVTDHPRDFLAGEGRPGVSYAALHEGVPDWLTASLAPEGADAVLLTPHWGPNMTTEPPDYVRAAAAELSRHATVVAGHSAHVVHGAEGNVLFDLGDFLDDYRDDPVLRNDLGLLFLVDLEPAGARRIEAVPLRLEYCYTRLAEGEDARWMRRRFREACRRLGTEVQEEGGRLVISRASG